MALDSRIYRQLLTSFMTPDETTLEIYAKQPWREKQDSVTTFDGVRLEWTEQDEDGAFVERVHENPNLGSAIAWGRRRLFRHDIVGRSITLRFIERKQNPHTQRSYADDKAAYEMSLAGFRRWRTGDHHYGLSRGQSALDRLQRRIYLKDHE
ncbi:hypothetical protein GURKE_02580 [Brevundimonas phage vB_BpoS-Gurke]|uniref:Uncharacterized protein n=1 Tax=Brevundimonas phage vB_BpoS-Gurke TaxID=2948599 RepID=A0A9E7N4N0_9CAUD|nr:hypothetical protein GURKE_02580 [Brevundimonas phage vB_BpoS-Gurke]